MSSNNTEIDALQPLLPFFHSKANAILHLRSRNFPHFYTLPPTSPVPLSFRRARSASMNLHFARISEKLLSSRFEPSGIRNNGAGEGREREKGYRVSRCHAIVYTKFSNFRLENTSICSSRIAEDLGIFKREEGRKPEAGPSIFPLFDSANPLLFLLLLLLLLLLILVACCPILSGSCRVNSGDSGRGRSEIDSRRESNS